MAPFGAILLMYYYGMKRSRTKLRHFFFAHKANKFSPGLFAKEAALVIVLGLLIVEGAYQVQIHAVQKHTGFSAAVLPAALTALANGDRALEGLGALEEDPALDAVAQAKADDMAAKGYFAHVSPDGKTPWSWLQAAGYEYSYAGENLAVDFTDSIDVEKAWMNSPMHRANIMKKQYTRVGIAVAQGMYEGKPVTFVAQFFAAKKEEGASTPASTRPASAAAIVPATQIAEAEAPLPNKVLGEASQAPTETLAVAATSPSHVLWYVFTAAAALLSLLLLLTLITHLRRRILYLEVLGSGLLVTGVAAALMLYSGSPSEVTIPSGAQAASAVGAL